MSNEQTHPNEDQVTNLCDGKYKLVREKSGKMYALRYDNPWRELTGDNLILALAQRIDDHEEADASRRALIRDLDVALNGESGAAQQASLCDIVSQVKNCAQIYGPLIHVIKESREECACAVAAIQYALSAEEGMEFLRYWNIGQLDRLRVGWPDAPAACYVGADPLLKPAAAITQTFEEFRDKNGFPRNSSQEPLWRECWEAGQAAKQLPAITPELMHEMWAHTPLDLAPTERWEWQAKYINQALRNPNRPCLCCDVTASGDIVDEDIARPSKETEKQVGLYNKYRVERTDGSSAPNGKHEFCGYFVLDLNHDRFARPALLAYASACQDEYPVLANDLYKKVGLPGKPLFKVVYDGPSAAMLQHASGQILRFWQLGGPGQDMWQLPPNEEELCRQIEALSIGRQQAARVDEDAVNDVRSRLLTASVDPGTCTPEFFTRLANKLEAALAQQGEEVAVAYWAAIADDGEIVVAYPADDGNRGEAARTECNQYINEALLNDRAALHLVPLYTRPAARARVPGEAVEASALRELVKGNGGWASCFNDELFVMWKDVERLINSASCAESDADGKVGMAEQMVSVNASALYDVLTALVGPQHLIRELQAVRGLPGSESSIDMLVRQYNAHATAATHQEPQS